MQKTVAIVHELYNVQHIGCPILKANRVHAILKVIQGHEKIVVSELTTEELSKISDYCIDFLFSSSSLEECQALTKKMKAIDQTG